MQYVCMDEEVRCDWAATRGRWSPVRPSPACGRKSRPTASLTTGASNGRSPGTIYYEATDPPLRRATIDDLERYAWPNLTPPGRFDHLVDEAKAIHKAGYATVLVGGITLFEQAYLMRGLDTILMDIAADPEFFTALMTKLKS